MFDLPSKYTAENLMYYCQYNDILSFIIAASMFCVFLCGALRNLRSINRQAGNAAYFEAGVFFIAQISVGLFNLWLSRGNVI